MKRCKYSGTWLPCCSLPAWRRPPTRSRRSRQRRAATNPSAASRPSAAPPSWGRKGKDWSCSTCHTTDPRKPGRHTVTGKTIQPMAPVSNPNRFTDSAKVEKWFKRNCRDVFDRECTAREKGDVITWLRSITP